MTMTDMPATEPELFDKEYDKVNIGPPPIIIDAQGIELLHEETVSIPASLTPISIAKKKKKYYDESEIKEWEFDCPKCGHKAPNLDEFLTHDIAVHRSKKESMDFDEQKHPRGGKGTKQGGKFVSKGSSTTPTEQKDKPLSLAPEQLMPPKNPLDLSPEKIMPVEFDVALKKFDDFVKTSPKKNYSFDPTIGKGFDAQNKTDALTFYHRFSDGQNELFVVGVTNHAGQLSRESHSAYEQVRNNKLHPLIGHWVSDETGFDYTDISFPLDHGVAEDEIKELLHNLGQESAIAVNKQGRARFINA